MVALLFLLLGQVEEDTQKKPPDLTLYVAVEKDERWADWRSHTTQLALTASEEDLIAKAPDCSNIREYARSVLALRDCLRPFKLLSREEAGLKSDVDLPAYTFHEGIDPKIIRKDVLWEPEGLLLHLVYLKRLHEYDYVKRGDARDPETWLPYDTNRFAYSENGKEVERGVFYCWKPVIMPFPAPPMRYKWSRWMVGIDQISETMGMDGDPTIEILGVMDQDTGIVQPAIDWLLRPPEEPPEPPL